MIDLIGAESYKLPCFPKPFQEAELAEKTLQAAEKNQKLHTLLHSKAKQAERMMIINQGLAFENSRIRNDIDLANISEVS